MTSPSSSLLEFKTIGKFKLKKMEAAKQEIERDILIVQRITNVQRRTNDHGTSAAFYKRTATN